MTNRDFYVRKIRNEIAEAMVWFAIKLTHWAERVDPEVFEIVDSVQSSAQSVSSSAVFEPSTPRRDK